MVCIDKFSNVAVDQELMKNRNWNGLWIGCLSALLVGCGGGPELSDVEGVVTVNGKPAANVEITFQPTSGGRASVGMTDEAGEYELIYSPSATGAIPGPHTVTIAAVEGVLAPEDTSTGSEMLEGPDSGVSEFAGVQKSVTVESGSNTIDVSFP
ncbi:hypothetical protein Rcae01_02937 [Novipirellula caenicola]|uniref:Carboxypeptidase regulatory-like domain-containing protein n=2 Tax=Novipirellula caenicola TaxID=1536901 RepID=A0ABP9VQQ1_9BACT